MRQVLWYALQIGIVVGLLVWDAHRPEPQPGLTLLVGIGYALTATIVVNLIGNGWRRLTRLLLPSRVKDGNAVLVPKDIGSRRDERDADVARRPRIGGSRK